MACGDVQLHVRRRLVWCPWGPDRLVSHRHELAESPFFICASCGPAETSQRRAGPSGPRTLCNRYDTVVSLATWRRRIPTHLLGAASSMLANRGVRPLSARAWLCRPSVRKTRRWTLRMLVPPYQPSCKTRWRPPKFLPSISRRSWCGLPLYSNEPVCSAALLIGLNSGVDRAGMQSVPCCMPTQPRSGQQMDLYGRHTLWFPARTACRHVLSHTKDFAGVR